MGSPSTFYKKVLCQKTHNMTNTLFQTERLFVRYFTKNDLDAFFDMVGNPKVMRYVKKPLSYEASIEELNRFIRYYEEDIFFNIWAAVEKESDQLVGLCGVYLNDKSEHEIAYRLRESFWGNGYGGEIAEGLLQFCFEDMNLKKLTAYVIEGNIGSIKILEKEMNFVESFFSKKENVMERKYELRGVHSGV